MSHVYDNVPLKPFKRDKLAIEQKGSSRISTIQKQEDEKKRKGSADFLKTCSEVQKKTKSKSISEMFFKGKLPQKRMCVFEWTLVQIERNVASDSLHHAKFYCSFNATLGTNFVFVAQFSI